MGIRMNLLLLCLLFLSAAYSADTMTHQGIMQIARKSVIAKDMLHILKTVFQNAKFWDYPDIKEEEKSGAFSKGMYLTDMEVTTVEFDPQPLVDTLTFDAETKKITLSTNKPILKYTFTFNWKAMAMGVHVAFGHGTATMTSKDISASYGLMGMISELNAAFDVAVVEITGAHSLVSGVKDWVLHKMTEVSYAALLKGIDYNRHFIAEYMHIQFKKLNKRLDHHHVLQYVSQPVDVAEVGDFLAYSHKIHLSINGEWAFEVTEETPIPLAPIPYDMAIYLSPQLVPLTIDVHGMMRKCDGEYDMTLLGLTGTVKDFFESMPELVSLYTGNEKLKMYCEYAHQKVEELGDRMILLPVRCNFTLSEGLPILSADVMFKMRYEPQVSSSMNKLYAASMTEVFPQKCNSNPRSMELNLFLMRMFRDFGKQKFEGKVLEVPMIRYEPYRDYNNSVVEIHDGSYVAYYNDLPQ